MIKGTLILLRDHKPSNKISEYFDKVTMGIGDLLQIDSVTVESNSDLKRLRKKYRFKDLPALKIEKRKDLYYGTDIVERLKNDAAKARKKKAGRGRNQAIRLQEQASRVQKLRARIREANNEH